MPLDDQKSQQEDVLAQVKVLLEEIRALIGNIQSYSSTWMRDQLCLACGKRDTLDMTVNISATQETCSHITRASDILRGR